MWPFSSVPKASPKRVAQLEAELADVQLTLAWLKKGLLDLNGRLSTVQRQQKRVEEAPEETIEEQPDIPVGGRPAVATAHLARRFRGF